MDDRIFDLEQQILQCWHVTDDLKLLAEQIMDSPDFTDMPSELVDKLANLVGGLEHVYDMRFQKCWETFEKHCQQYHTYRRAWDEPF